MSNSPNSPLPSQGASAHANELVSSSLLRDGMVVLIKGRSRRVHNNQAKKMADHILTLGNTLPAHLGPQTPVVVVWDGDDVRNGSFTGTLQQLCGADIEFPIHFVYAMSTTSPYPPRPPAGLKKKLSGCCFPNVNEVECGDYRLVEWSTD
jgi:hypothetical protein